MLSENPLDCDFDAGTFCNWEVKTWITTQWQINSGPTATFDTGPSHDHTESKNDTGKCCFVIFKTRKRYIL